MSDGNEPMQLGFSEKILDPNDADLIAHNSSNWADWDGGKIGGAPSWLNPKEIPTSLRCEVCAERNAENKEGNKEGTLMRFLTQIYSPADIASDNKNSFHRSLYVFCCPHPICSSAENAHKSALVLRCQLPKENEFYPPNCDSDEDESWDKHESKAWGINLCIMCGQKASGRCPKANEWFCCKDHQKIYNKALDKRTCSNDSIDLSPYIYEESELVVEEEPEETQNGENHNSRAEITKDLNESSIFADEGGDQSDELLEQSDLNAMTGTGAGTDDPTTLDFYSRIDRALGDVKSQCLRYCRWQDVDENSDELEQTNGPLWISSKHQPAAGDIPPCEYCGEVRKFEFQVMPQMISFLKSNVYTQKNTGESVKLTEDGKRALLAASDIVDKAKEDGTEADLPEGFQKKQEELVEKLKATILQDDQDDDALDFGTLAIYSCTASCDGKRQCGDSLGAYRKEFVWRQKPLE